jgi:nucleotide-binding universal stress UspA family protein
MIKPFARSPEKPVAAEHNGFATRHRGSTMQVLLGVDGTDGSLRALDQAAERAAEAGDELTVGIAANPAAEAGFETGADLEARVCEVTERANVDTDFRRLDGNLGSELVALADADDYDRLVVGGGERSPMGKIELGHNTQFVLLNARTSVTLVR